MAGLRMKQFAGAIAAIALCASPTMASAATSAPAPSMNPLIAVGVFGTQASAQQVCASAAATAAAAGAAVNAAQGQAGCVLPVTDPPPPVVEVAPPPPSSGFGIGPILLGLVGIAALVALLASGDDDDDDPAESPD